MQVSPDASPHICLVVMQTACYRNESLHSLMIALGVQNCEKMLLLMKRGTTLASQVMVGMASTHLDT